MKATLSFLVALFVTFTLAAQSFSNITPAPSAALRLLPRINPCSGCALDCSGCAGICGCPRADGTQYVCQDAAGKVNPSSAICTAVGNGADPIVGSDGKATGGCCLPKAKEADLLASLKTGCADNGSPNVVKKGDCNF